MAASRSSIKFLTRALGTDAATVNFLRRHLSFVVLSKPAELSNKIVDYPSESSCCGRRSFSVSDQRGFRTSARASQQSQLENDLPAGDASQPFQPVPLPLRNYSPVLSGFSVLPNTAVGVPAGLSPPSSAGSFNLDQLGKEMSTCLSQGRLEEAVLLFENWLKFPDLQGKSKVPNIMTYNLLLHAKLRLGVDPRHMLQVIRDMEMNRLTPNLLSYNFLLRAIFRQRDSKMAEGILEK